jgi:alkylmercury lyase
MVHEAILGFLAADVTPDELSVRKAAFHAILGGEVLDRAGLTKATGFTPEKVDTLLAELNGRGLIVFERDSDRVVGSWGLSSVPTDHDLHIRGRVLHTWCAVDAVGIPAALEEDARIASRCALCAEPVTVEMAAGQVAHASPSDMRLWVTGCQVGRSVVGFT